MTNPASRPLQPASSVLFVDLQQAGQRLDAFLVEQFPKYSRVKLQRAIVNGDVLLDEAQAKPSSRLKLGQTVTFRSPEASPQGPIAEDIPLDLIYEDDHFVAINKPPGMVVHPAKGHWSGTLTSALAWHFETLSTIGGPTRPGIVHRLDRDTSGVILVARTDQAHAALSQQFEARTVEKSYFTIVSPAPDRDRDQIDKPIGNHPYQREKKAIRENHSSSRPAVSFYEVLDRFGGFATVRVMPKTGRTHQIRLHMAHIGCPVLCDRLYGGRSEIWPEDLTRKPSRQLEMDADKPILDRQALHAHRITFAHPVTSARMTLEAPLPADINRTVEALKLVSSGHANT